MQSILKALVITHLSFALSLPGTGGPGFGTYKDKVTLQRKLPAMAHLPGVTFKVRVTSRESLSEVSHDLGALLETELLKDDSHLRAEETSPSTIIACQVIEFSHPQPTVTQKPQLAMGKNAPRTQAYKRITGALTVAFQAKTASGQTLISNNVIAKYDEEFDSAGNDSSHGVTGTLQSTWQHITGKAGNEDLNPPTDDELRARLMQQVVRKIAEHLVNTNEVLEVYLAKNKGALDEGDKQAQAGLWQRALETYETAPPLPKPVDDAYRLYDIGVAYEALAYAAQDDKTAMKFLDEAAINYGKAVDAKPAEKYFLEPQKRIETAIAHYKELEETKRPKAAETVPPTSSSAGSASAAKAAAKALNNAQVIAMVKSGMAEDTVVQAIRGAKNASFDLSEGGQQELASNGVSNQVLSAMKARAAHRTVAAK
ncbi:MAG TPA: hypothetical protein VK764_05725 [Terracidiphilus sp.]|jgi:tetratricopeptide (TPR) repeat protein|nr:hypothetical protein [Terracidiphilus sp.]